jgi:menaquinone-9 beta-reductase
MRGRSDSAMIDIEAVIIGGGPAGSTCAWKLRQGGVDAAILDQYEFPRHKLCAGWVTPRVVRDLALDASSHPGLYTFDRLHYHFYGHRLTLKTRQYAIRRYKFDAWLLQRSAAPFYQHKVRKIRQENGRYIIDDAYRCTYLIGAGGTNCPVYRTFFKTINPRAKTQQIVSLEEEFEYEVQDPNCYLWFFDNGLPGYAWYVPKGENYLNIGIGGKAAALAARGETIQAHWNLLTEKLEQLGLVLGQTYQPKGHHYHLSEKVRNGQLGNVFIVGDAAGLATKDMGEGIGPAVESAILAAEAILQRKPYSLRSVTRFSAGELFKGLFNK